MPRRPALLLLGCAALAAACAGCDSGPATATTAPSNAASNTDTASESPAVKLPATGPRPKLLPGAMTKVLAAAGNKQYDKTFDDIRFEMKLEEPFRRQMLTDSIESMFGQRIRIRGFIIPPAQKRGIKQFVLVRDDQECCFGPGAALFDCIFVEMKPGNTVEYSGRPVAVEGTFGFKEIIGPNGRHWAIYHLDAESVQ
ncbi:MAG: DUF3299 domain-containing protein [Pirellulales bacterium]